MWHSKTYPNQAAVQADQLEVAFKQLVSTQGQAVHNAGIFIFYPAGSPAATLYFSPETAPLAERVGAQPCDRPELRNGMGLYLSAGSPTQAHFPEKFPAPRKR